MFNDWEFDRLKAHVDGILAEADQQLHGALALEPNDPQRETQVNHWTAEEANARGLLAKLGQMKATDTRPL